MIKKTKFLIKEARLRIKYKMTKDCILCKIINGEIPKEFILRTDKVVAFDDINPVSAVHILIVPTKHIDSVETVTEAEGLDLVEIYKAAAKIVKEKNLDAFRLAFNGGKFQHVPHLHMHLLAGSKIEWRKL